MAKENEHKQMAQNRKARHDYFILETYEAGIELKGTEVKSVRAGRVNLQESYARVDKGQCWLLNVHISPYEAGNRFNVDPMRPRRLLMHKREILKLQSAIKERGYTLVPLSFYLKDSLVKVELGVAQGKKQYDKRDDEAERSAKRVSARAVKEGQRYQE